MMQDQSTSILASQADLVMMKQMLEMTGYYKIRDVLVAIMCRESRILRGYVYLTGLLRALSMCMSQTEPASRPPPETINSKCYCIW